MARKKTLDKGLSEAQSARKRELEILSKHVSITGEDRAICQAKDGRWYTYLPTRMQLKRSSYKGLLDALEEFYKKYESNLDEGDNIKGLAKAALEEQYKDGTISGTTYKREMADFKMMFEGDEPYKTEFMAKDYSQFCSADIEHYLKQLITKNNLTKKAYVNCKTLLINALKYARRHRLIEYDYNALFKELNGLNRLCSKKGKELEEQVFNDEEMIKLMQELRFLAPDSPRKEALLDFAVMLAALFGIRPGEVTALKYSDFKFTYMKEASLDELNLYTCRKYPNPYLTYAPAKDGKEPFESHKGFMLYYAGEYGEPMDSPTVCEISVTKSEKEKVIKDETKTKNNRKVNVSDPYLDRAFFWSILRADTDPEDFIFRTKDACIYSEDITKHLKKICSKIGIPERSATALRKSYCMRLIKQGANDAEIIERMGHVTIKTARDYYMRLYETPAEKYETAKKLSSFVK